MNRKTSILLIDDSASVREVLRVALESEGYRVIEAADGREGVGLYREHRPGLVIADIVMPEKDGIETAKEILAIDSAAVVFTMSGRDEDFQEVAMLLGAKRGFRKPVVRLDIRPIQKNARGTIPTITTRKRISSRTEPLVFAPLLLSGFEQVVFILPPAS